MTSAMSAEAASPNPQQKFSETPSDAARTKQERLVICITGMPGAGKSVVAEVSRQQGFEIYRMGDDVRMEADRRKVTPTDENLGAIMLQLRQSGGPVAVAALCGKRILRDARSKFILIDGIRNINEFLEFKKLGRTLLVCIYASPERRFAFLRARNRSDSPSSFQSFEARDRRELSVGLGEAIALADEVLVNKGTLGELEVNARELFLRLKEESKNKQ